MFNNQDKISNESDGDAQHTQGTPDAQNDTQHVQNTPDAPDTPITQDTQSAAQNKEKTKSADAITKIPTWKNLLRFSFPTILSMLLMNTFGTVDGIFVSRFIGPIALAPVSVVFPFLAFIMAIGFMLGVGGNAMIAKKLGQGREQEGRQNFSLIVLTAIFISTAFMVFGLIFYDEILNVLGVDDYIRHMALDYLKPLLWFLPTTMLGIVFQQFLITAGKAHYSAIAAFFGGITSASLNFIFIRLLDMGIHGAALATSIGYTLPAIVGLIFFSTSRKSNLYFVMPKIDFRALGRTCINGASEMVTMLAISITSVIMNNILLDLGGSEAQAAAGVMFAGMGIFSALFIGYSSGVIPIISYNFGKGAIDNLKKAYSNSLMIIGTLSAFAVALAFLSTDLLISIYDIPHYSPIHAMASSGFRIIASGFILMGFNAFASMFFTALNNGLISSLLSLFRTLVFVVIAFLTLPPLFGLTGAWAAMPAAEGLGIIMTVVFFRVMRKRYNYA